MVLALTLYTVVSTQEERDHTVRDMLLSADRLSDVIKRSTRSAMLRNQRESVTEIIETVAREPGIEGISIYNKRGDTIYSGPGGAGSQPVDMDAEACFGCHGQGRPLESLPVDQRVRFYDSGAGFRVMGLINPIMNEPDCSNAACHAHPPSQTILGVVDVKMSLADADARMWNRQVAIAVLAAVVILLVTTVTGFFVYFLVHVPVRKLIRGTRAISSGDLDYVLDVKSTSEMGVLSDSFRRMTSDLRKAREESSRWSETLEQKVQDKTAQLKSMQAQMLQAEKMVSLGRLSATVAHELNNPLAGVLTYTRLVMKKLGKPGLTDEDRLSLLQTLETMSSETSRCGNIVKNMLLFSRQRETRFRPERLHDIMDGSIELVRHHLEINSVEVSRRFDAPDDALDCDANQLKQAFIAMFINAAEAMPKGGRLSLATEAANGGSMIRILVTDSGHGIPDDIRHLIFEPFFTTKKEGSGVGLGLSVVYGVVRQHGGNITVQSSKGEGTTFVIELPKEGTPGDGAEVEP